jgi:hypothetical protein
MFLMIANAVSPSRDFLQHDVQESELFPSSVVTDKGFILKGRLQRTSLDNRTMTKAKQNTPM